MANKKFILFTVIVITLFALVFYFSRKNSVEETEEKRSPAKVTAQSAEESKFFLEKRTYPGTVVGEQEIAIVSQISGVISNAPYEIGSPIKTGSLLARIDDAGRLDIGESGFRSNQIQQSELSAAQAKKSYGLSKDTYHDTKKSDLSTKIQKEVAKTQKEIAALQYEAAKISLRGSIDNHLITSPINGFVISKNVSVGDSISQGQIIATLSKTSAIKIQFYVNQMEKESFFRGQEVTVLDSNKKQFGVTIKNISVQADPQTKRFLIEATPKAQDSAALLLGTIVTIAVEKKQEPQDKNNFILPLSAITITQNENYIFVAKQDVVKKEKVEIVRIIGENAEIAASLADDASIIVKGNKVLNEGETVSIENNS